MLLNDRQRELLEEVEARRQVTVERLSQVLYASPATIRRDLALLSENGYLQRVRGGAVYNMDETADPPLLLRMNRDVKEKASVARVAGRLLQDGMTLFLDSSTTAAHLCPEIACHRGMTIITNNMRVFTGLLDAPGVRTILCGGEVYLGAYTFSQNGLEMVHGYYVDLLFFSCAGLSAENQISDKEERVVAMKQAMLQNSARKVLLCTGSKVGAATCCRLCGLEVPDRVICDTDSAGLRELFPEEKLIIAGKD